MSLENDRHRLEVAERHLGLIQSFIPRIDSKVSALFAITSAQLVVSVINLSAVDLEKWYVTVPFLTLLICLSVTYLNLYRCAYPHLDGGHASLIYFGEIAKRREFDFIQQYKSISVADLATDVIGQIWRNSEIVSCKYRYLKTATQSAMISLLPWAIVLIATSLSNDRIPILSK